MEIHVVAVELEDRDVVMDFVSDLNLRAMILVLL